MKITIGEMEMTYSAGIKTLQCKYCGNKDIVKCGSYKGVPRYFCNSCRRKFKNDDHAFYMQVPAKHIGSVLELYYKGVPVNEIKKYMENKEGYSPSIPLMRYWIAKITGIAAKMLQNHHPRTGNIWVLNEIILTIGKRNLYIYEIIDEKTNYILHFMAYTGGKRSFQPLVREASVKAGIVPEVIMVYMPITRFNVMKKGTGFRFQHVPKEAYADRHRTGISGNPEMYDTEIYRLKNPQRLKIFKIAVKYFEGLTIHHNYFASEKKPGGKTPAEAAQIDYACHNWTEIIEQSTLSHR